MKLNKTIINGVVERINTVKDKNTGEDVAFVTIKSVQPNSNDGNTHNEYIELTAFNGIRTIPMSVLAGVKTGDAVMVELPFSNQRRSVRLDDGTYKTMQDNAGHDLYAIKYDAKKVKITKVDQNAPKASDNAQPAINWD